MNKTFAHLALATVATLFALGAAVGSGAARADDDEATASIPPHPAYRDECGSCHVPYPPGLLSADSWRAMMAGLDKHFGSDATLDAATAADITRYLVAHAGRRDTLGRDGQPLLRITDTRWFRKEHRDGHDGITPGMLRSAAVKSPANCGACHRSAAQGDYSEDNIQLPRNGGRS